MQRVPIAKSDLLAGVFRHEQVQNDQAKKNAQGMYELSRRVQSLPHWYQLIVNWS